MPFAHLGSFKINIDSGSQSLISFISNENEGNVIYSYGDHSIKIKIPSTRFEWLNKNRNNTLVKNILSSPEALVQFADLLTYFDGKSFKLDHFEKQAESRVNSKLKDIIEKNGFNQTTTGAKGSSDIEDLFKKFKAVV
jgi:hypothetical protein